VGDYKSKLNKIKKHLSTYNSDEDLDEEAKKLLSVTDGQIKRDKIRAEGWKRAGAFQKLRRAIKDGFLGDIHKKDKEAEDIIKKKK